MIVELTPDIWYGDKPSVMESVGRDRPARSIINVAHSIRRPYWKDLGKLDWETWYFRLSCPDRVAVTDSYMRSMERVLDSIQDADKFPILCHCRAGGHRGPTAAFFAAFYLDGAKRFDYWIEKMVKLKPEFNTYHRYRIYRQTVLDWCRK